MPRLILLSLLPLIVASASAFGLAWFFWEDAVNGVRDLLEGWQLLAPALHWLDGISGGAFRSVIGPLIVVALSVPVLLITALLLVAVFMGPAIVSLVAQRRFPQLQKRQGASVWRAVAWGLGSTAVALVALVLSLPFWLFPPAALLLPPLIWGWLTYRVMAFDAWADHASAEERRTLMRRHRLPLLGMGVATGYLGAAPSLIWAFGVLALPMMPLLVPLFVWLYTLVFAFSSAWFCHYCLDALDRHRRATEGAPLDLRDLDAARAPANVHELSTVAPSTSPPSLPPALPPGPPPGP
jgi:hypothetical protein